ncbi:hypothetical protein CHLRE_12g498650v5 [Chlamydomonas reinhardtii]|uniref:Protein kinase domain-containing protein n=1 Tax=Chlamydomonas reinhardtii TaxID=3055 RepID=A8JGJ4_CHLRE|nr:uncharacterized protein CHLRE_12g498650v5 [Chlamydomonas reinhardtii]PNW75054.1 hypothetical protein CHLRE_12g498650v5 [Chlamydomonas reinhardtii]|eukprot:XP_001702346.1 aurora-like kinase [Chlamydomonas reinhardtii]
MELPGYYSSGKGELAYDSYEKHDKQGFLKGLLGGKDDGKKASPKASPAPASPSVPKKFMDMISPLLLGSSNSSSAANSPANAKAAQAAPSASAFSKAAAALQHAAADGCPATMTDAQNMDRAMSYNSGLTEYVNKMKIDSEAGANGQVAAAAGKRSKLSNESTLSSSSSMSAMSVQSSRSAGAPVAPMPHLTTTQPGVAHVHAPPTNVHMHGHGLAHGHHASHAHHHHAPAPAPAAVPQQTQQPQPVAAGHKPGAALNSHAYASNLDRLLEAARHCQLPQSGRPLQPMPADPLANPHHGPTIPLVVSPNLPPRMQRPQWRLTDYQLGDKLYTGYASTVYKAVCRASGEVVVLKIYHLMSVCDLYKYQIYREVRVHSNLCHENIVHLYAAFQEGDKVILVQEYADGSDLFTLLHKYGGRLSERLAVQLVLEPFLRVLQYLHSRAIIHRDIKPENILFNKAMCLKLGDFGLAIDLREERAVTRAGTLDYMAPEVLRCPFKSRPEENKDNERLHYSARVDAWAVGVLTYELLVGFPPFFDQSRTSTEERINHSMPAFPAGMSEEAKAFVSSALSKHAAERPTILEMLHHPWIARFSSRRSMRAMPGAASPLASPVQQPQPQQQTPRRPAPPPGATPTSAQAMPGSPGTPLRPPAPVPAGGFPTLGSLLAAPQLDVKLSGHMGHHAAPASPQSPLVMKSSSESTELLNSRFSQGSSNASMQM